MKAYNKMLRGEKTIRVLICNKYALFREGIKALLPQGGRIEVVGEAASARQAIGMVDQLRPDVVLLDVTMPDLSGREATRRIKAIAPGVKVLIIPRYDDKPLLSGCLKAGAAGYVGTHDLPLQLKSAIQTVYRRGAHAA